ncbi:U11/U12 small nuclear ribonucleoprotein 48 kDa protein isoform X2 [Lotus japonicus]|nr:U11/U12 small nuclear ribonucleoprotein 48 kDa protein isoform X2 [Lotus japonicus]XP_057458972.1 U11/U12 small nuclear ribonucleoprotein 48 kDa protein isoform X2 [Lotus japonicus]
MMNNNLQMTLSSLNNLLDVSNHILPITPTLNTNLIQCPFNPHHLVPPSSLFLHHLGCPSSPRPLPNPNDLLHTLSYPKSLHNPQSLQLSSYLNSPSNLLYRDCPGVVSFSNLDTVARTATFALPDFLSRECEDRHTGNSNSENVYVSAVVPVLPSEHVAIARELETWHGYPTTCSNAVRRAISGLEIAKERGLSDWLIVNSPRYGIVIDTAMQQHIFLLCCLCFKSILREASVSRDNLLDCPVLNQALTWLESQVSILYGATNGKCFVLDFVKRCIMVGASVLLLFPLGDEVASQISDNVIGGLKDAMFGAQNEERSTNCILYRKIFVPQVVAAVAALHERSLLEQEIKGLWFSRQPSNYHLVAEHGYLSEKANEERKKRPDYRPLVEHDWFLRQQPSGQEAPKEKTREELLAEERDYKRRRMSYRGKKTNQSPLHVMRDLINEYMEDVKQAAGVQSPVKVSEDSGMFPPKLPSSHGVPREVNNYKEVSLDSTAMTISNPGFGEQQSQTKYTDKSKAVDDAFSRDYERRHYRNHSYGGAQQNADRGTYHRDRASSSPDRQISHSRAHDHSILHKRKDYSNRKRYDDSSRTRDRREKDTHRNYISDSSLNNAFSDRYDPSESLHVREDDINSDAKYIKPDKFSDQELH